jgi:hypothetical protein
LSVLLVQHDISNITLDHIVVDGNRGQRRDTGPGISCGKKWAGHESEGRGPGYNSAVHNCASCTLVGFASINALCGTGCEFSGADARIERSAFLNNGDHFGRNSGRESHKWSDGLTINSGPRCTVRDCLFVDNSDINFILANAHGGHVSGNTIRMINNAAFGGIMMDNFNNPSYSNHSGLLVSNNTIDCAQRCHYGIEVGPFPWYTAAPIFGGEVSGNRVGGAGFSINVDGAGVAHHAVRITHNQFVGQCVDGYPCVSGKVVSPWGNCSHLNIAPNAVVDRGGDTAPMATHFAIRTCP